MKSSEDKPQTVGLAPTRDTRILITGIGGFTGIHMLHMLIADGCAKHLTGAHFGKIEPSTYPKNTDLRFVECDVTDFDGILEVVRESSPDIVYHFAGLASVAQSFRAPMSYLNVNVEGTMNLLEAVRKMKTEARVLVPGSAETYGRVDIGSMPIREDLPQRPSNPYALSKLLQERLCGHYHEELGMQVYLTRTFNSVGPGQGVGFVCSDFAKQIAQAERIPNSNVIKVGNLAAKRDFLDVRDLVRAYTAIVNKGRPGYPYNVCSGKSVEVRQVLDTLVSLSKVKMTVEEDPSKLRPVDVPEFVGDNSRLRSDTSWLPRISLDRTLADVLEWWRSRTK